MNVFIAGKAKPFNQVQPSVIKDTTAQLCATQKTAKRTGSQASKTPGRAELVVTRPTENGCQRIKSVWLTSRLVGTQESVVPRVHTPLKNGHGLRTFTAMYVQSVNRISRLQKTMLCHSRRVALTTSQIFNHCAETAIAKNGLSFNIYENPDLLAPKPQQGDKE